MSSAFSQEVVEPVKEKHFGISLNGAYRIENVGLIAAVSCFYHKNGQEIGLGVVTQPFYNAKNRTYIGAQLNYKFFPNQLENKFNLYFTSYLNYLARLLNGNYSYNTHSLSLTFGFGFQVKISKNFYLGTDIGVGFTTSSLSFNGNPPPYAYAYGLFTDYDFDAILNFNIGYRF